MFFFLAAAWLSFPVEMPVSFSDLERFPGLIEAAQQLAFSEEHLRWLDERCATHGDGYGMREWCKEAQHCHDCWRALYDAHRRDITSIWWGRDGDQLRGLRRMIGTRNYMNGAMPPAAPFWLFNSGDQ